MKKIILTCLIAITSLQLIPSTSHAQQAFDIYYDVPFIPQPNGVYCWSSSIAMIMWWKNNEDAQMSQQSTLTPEQVANYNDWWQRWFPEGLNYADQRPFTQWGFRTLAPQSFTLEYFQRLLSNSPLWICYNPCANPLLPCGNHAVVIVGARSDGTEAGTTLFINDPDDGSGVYPNAGVRNKQMPYTEFIDRLNTLATSLIDYDASQHGGVQSNEVNFLAYLPR